MSTLGFEGRSTATTMLTLAVLRFLEAEGRDVPVLFLTTMSGIDDRVEGLEGGGGSLLWINDRCFLVMTGLIPFPMCGIGKIPVRGDLFDRMRERKGQEPNTNNIAP